MLIDSHCHLDFPELVSQLDDVIARAGEAGVGLMLTIATSLERFPGVLAVAERVPNVYCTVGIHPHEAAGAGSSDELTQRLIALAQHPKVVGLGETGLDYFYENSPRDAQVRAFEAHIDAARATGLPLIIHTRDADDDMANILTREGGKGDLTGLIHCFSSSAELAETALEIGFYISFSGIVTFKKAETVRAIAATVPVDRILVETDAPYLAPVPHRGKTNEPSFVAHTAQVLSELRSIPLPDIEKQTSHNFMQLFKKIPDASGDGTRWRNTA